MPNHEMLEIVMKHIETHPEQHDQNVWGLETECGTTACFAGWTMLLNGYTMKTVDDGRDVVFVRPNGTEVCFETTEAARLLDLKEGQASHMFLDLSTAKELRQYVDNLKFIDGLK